MGCCMHCYVSYWPFLHFFGSVSFIKKTHLLAISVDDDALSLVLLFYFKFIFLLFVLNVFWATVLFLVIITFLFGECLIYFL